MRINVYIPEDLAAQYHQNKQGLNLSGIAQAALRRELARTQRRTANPANFGAVLAKLTRFLDANDQFADERVLWLNGNQSISWGDLRALADYHAADVA